MSGQPYVPGGYVQPSMYPNMGPPHSAPHMHNPPQQLQTQQIYIPNDLVGCIIGKGGSKINEIRHMSASQIKIMEPGATAPGMNGAPGGTENERLVIVTGQPQNVQMAVQLLYHVRILYILQVLSMLMPVRSQRLEQEKQKIQHMSAQQQRM